MTRLIQIENINSDIQEIYDILGSEKHKDNLEEKVLSLLGNIEEKVSQIIGDKKERTAVEKENVFQKYVSMNHIDTEYTSIDDILDKLIDVIYQEIENKKIKLDFDIFEVGNSEISSKGKSVETIEIKTAQKIKVLQRILYNMGYNSGDIQQYEEKINSNRMRCIPYQIFHLKEEGNEKTILICNQIGQATFIYDGIIKPSIFQSVEKGEIINNIQPLKIIYRGSTFEKNIEVALNGKLSLEEKDAEIINKGYEKSDLILRKVDNKDLMYLWKNGEIEAKMFGSKWKQSAERWNTKNSEDKGYQLPTSLRGLIGKLGGDTSISKKASYIISLLEGVNYVEKRIVTKEELQELWNDKIITRNVLSTKWKIFSKKWNLENSKKKGYQLPTSYYGFIGKIGGKIKVSTAKDYVISLLEGGENN